MNKKYLALALSLATGFASTAGAADWFPGQSGQYHVIPPGQDFQNLTLIGRTDASCPSGVALFSVDEFGEADKVPFVVPFSTVFILTDAMFVGTSFNNQFGGYTPVLNIAQTSVPSAWEKASFLASRPLQGVAGEKIAGSGSLQNGAAFAVNSTLCAKLAFSTGQYGGDNGSLPLDAVIVHGKLIDNMNTVGFSW